MTNDLSLQYQAKTEAPSAFIKAVPQFESAWHEPWSEPVRQRILPALAIALIASGYVGPLIKEPGPEYESQFHYGWSEPVRIKPRLLESLQQFYVADTTPIPTGRNMAWYANYSEPVRQKPGLAAGLQQFFTTNANWIPSPGSLLEGWYAWLSEPVRQKLGLGAWLQQFLAYHPRVLPTPNVFVTINVTETNADVALFAIDVYTPVTPTTSGVIANVSIIEVQTIAGGFGSIERASP